jgi:hypothetical protein
MGVALRDPSDGDRLFRLRRLAAVWTGVAFSLVMTLGVALLAMEHNRAGHGWYIVLAIGGSLWLQIVTVIAAQNTARIWPAVLVLVTISAYLATACTLAISNYWVVALFWLVVAVTVWGGARQIATHDTQHSRRPVE